MQEQGSFDFSVSAQGEGYSRWLKARQIATGAMAMRLNLPLGHEVEVWLRGEIRLRGRLRLKEDQLFIHEEAIAHLELRVGDVDFRAGEVERCIRLD